MVIDKVSDRSNERLAKTYFFRRLAVGICHEKMRDGVEQRTPDESLQGRGRKCYTTRHLIRVPGARGVRRLRKDRLNLNGVIPA